MRKLSVAAVLPFVLFASAAEAGIPPSVPPTVTTTTTPGGNKIHNRAYAGVKWTLGEGWTPAVVVGFRRAEVEPGGDTRGNDVSLSFTLAGGIRPETLRAKVFDGKEDLQGELGLGYSFAKKGFFAGVGAQGPYVNPGVDWVFAQGGGLQPYLIINTLGKYDVPAAGSTTTTLSCEAGYQLNAETGLCDPILLPQ